MLRRPLLSLACLLPLLVSTAAAQAPAGAAGLLAREPQTPLEQYDAAVTMLKLSRPELARQYLTALLAARPDDAVLFALRDKYGTATFVQMSRMEELQPDSVTLLDLLNAAAQNQLADPAFQASLVQGLSGTARERDAALSTLRALGDQAAPLIIQRLAAGAQGDEEVALLQTLLTLGPSVAPPLAACLTSRNERIQTITADLLGRLGAEAAVLPLSATAFDPQSPPSLADTAKRALARIQFGGPQYANQVTSLRLVERLKHEARACLARSAAFDVGDDGLTPLWSWSDAAGTAVLTRVAPVSAALARGEEWSRAALRLAGDDADAQAVLLAHLLWRDVQTAGWDQPIPIGPGTAHDLALSLSPDVVERTLRLATEHDNSAAEVAALKVLGQTGSRGSLLAAGSPLLTALESGDARVQFAAAETILQLDPQQPFAGAAKVVDVLARAVNAGHQPKSVVVDPNTDRGAAIAGLISTLGFTPGLATTGQQGFEMAVREGNVELAVLHLNTIRWDLSQTLANLRADPRTKQLPIAVYGPSELRGATAPKLRPYRLVSYLDDPSDAGTIREQLTPLLAARSVPELTEPQRTAQTAAAAFWLRHIAEGQRIGIFPLERAETALLQSADHGAVARDVLLALGAIGKPTVQARLAEVALSSGLSLETRRAAIIQLAFHIQKFGRMLDNDTARQAAAAYQSETAPELQTLWAGVVGALRPDPQAATPLLLNYPPPQSPLP